MVVHVTTLRSTTESKTRSERADVIDYLIGILIVGLLSFAAIKWNVRIGNSSNTPPQASSGTGETQASPSWLPHFGASATHRAPDSAAEPDASPDSPPRAIRVVPAEYTPEARNAGFRGVVSVVVFISAAGLAQRFEPISPIPFGLERNISAAILQWRFQPAVAHGRPVPSKTVVEIPFR